jgi:manganese-dependent ADP-ribose/CDP-alcohol diphosphatase
MPAMTRRQFFWSLPLTGAVMAADPVVVSPRLRFGVIADCQYADEDVNQKLNRYYRLSPQKLREAVAALNRSPLDFTVNLGDTIDREFDSFETVVPIFRQLRATCYHALGNHDFDVAPALKKLVAKRMGVDEGTFFSWHCKGWRFLMLDGNEISLFAHAKEDPEYAASESYFRSLPGTPANYNGAIGRGQLAWLRGELEAARLHHERVIVFCHYPVFPANVHNLWNAGELVGLLSSFKDVVAAWMNGHNHAGNYGTKDSVHYLNFKGMVDTTGNCWAEVAVFDDRIEVTGFAREPSRTLKT